MPNPNISVNSIGVGSGSMFSSRFEIGRAQEIVLTFPVIDSAAAFLRGSWDGTTFYRMHAPHPNSGTYQMFPAAGSMALVVHPVLLPMKYGQVEFTVSQAALRTITVISRVW